ncbi:MAG: hypothetical protein LUG14_06835 [Synergistaceae bacterium]|nr:hypothetical protein [Synergistaceae bacterium]
MRILEKTAESGTLSVALLIEPEEFCAAMGMTGEGGRGQNSVSGEAEAVFDEALAAAIPAAYGKFIAAEGLRTVGRPEVTEIYSQADGGLRFSVKVGLYPKVRLGAYSGLQITLPPEAGEDEFRMAVLKEACKGITGATTPEMTDGRLEAMAAQERLNVSQDAVYHLPADVVWLLRETYLAAGISRQPAQIASEALEVMLETVSDGAPSAEVLGGQMRALAERYRELPDNFDDKFDEILKRRAAAKGKMTAEELAAEAFNAWLGSVGLDEKRWRAQRRAEAEELARCDLMLEAVAETEGLTASEDDLLAMIAKIAAGCGMAPEEATARIDAEPLRRQIMRDKACGLLVSAAVRKDG